MEPLWAARAQTSSQGITRSKCCEMVTPRAPESATVTQGETQALLHSEPFLCRALRCSRPLLLPGGGLASSALGLAAKSQHLS